MPALLSHVRQGACEWHTAQCHGPAWHQSAQGGARRGECCRRSIVSIPRGIISPGRQRHSQARAGTDNISANALCYAHRNTEPRRQSQQAQLARGTGDAMLCASNTQPEQGRQTMLTDKQNQPQVYAYARAGAAAEPPHRSCSINAACRMRQPGSIVLLACSWACSVAQGCIT